MNEELIGWIIFGVTVAAFVVFGFVMWRGRRLRYPPGIRLDAERDGLRVVVVWEPGTIHPVDPGELADACIDAVRSVVAAWKQLGLPGNAHEAMDRCCCLFLSDHNFETPKFEGDFDWGKWLEHVAAYCAQVPRSTGGGPPMLVIRSRFASDIIETGEPVIHESLHPCSLAGQLAYRDHRNPRVWIDAGMLSGREPEHTAQGLAWQIFERGRVG